ncbi:TolC family outer membrane protein [Isoalcanivorax beigongshangi]|uniref:TolC family outer membrane protein n=1 Tax=Isoalcanivorax beigongshangi TaxID=3238810 RepID=A0ABV4AFW8_9GAMM
MFKLKTAIAAGVALLTGALQPAYSATLAEVLEAAWQADSEWNAALRTWEADQQLENQGRAALLPNVNASYSWLKNDLEVRTGAKGDHDYESQTLTLSLVQPLFQPQAWYGYKQLKATTSVAAANFASARQDFLLRVSNQYFGVLRGWEDLTTLRAQERAIGRQLEQTRERYDVGLVAQTDVLEAQAAYDLTQSDRILAEAQFEIARDRLEALTNRNWDSLAKLQDDLPLDGPLPAKSEEWVELARARNPQLLMALYQSEVQQNNARVQAWAHSPTVDFVAQHQRYRDDDDTLQPTPPNTRNTAYGVEVKLPLFQGGAVASRRKQAALQYEASQETYQRTWRDVGQQALSSFRVVHANALRIKAREQAIRSAQSALEATQAGYDVGTRNIVDVLNAQRTLFSAQRDYATTRYDYITESLTLKAVAGVLSEDDLQQVDQWLSRNDEVTLDDVVNDQDA